MQTLAFIVCPFCGRFRSEYHWIPPPPDIAMFYGVAIERGCDGIYLKFVECGDCILIHNFGGGTNEEKET